MSQHNQLATILDMVGLKADLRTKLYETLPHAWPQEVDRFLRRSRRCRCPRATS